MDKRTYIEEFIIFSPQQYVVVRDKDYPDRCYTLQKQNLNYVINKNLVNNIEYFDKCKTQFERRIHALFFVIQGKISSAMYKIPPDHYYNRFYLVWSILYKKDKIDSFYDALRKEPLMLKKLLEKILAQTNIHYSILSSYPLQDATNLIEIYRVDIDFIIPENYNFIITFHLYDITTKEFHKRVMEFKYHPDENIMQRYHDRAIAWHKNNLINQAKNKQKKKDIKAYIESLKDSDPERYFIYKKYPGSIT